MMNVWARSPSLELIEAQNIRLVCTVTSYRRDRVSSPVSQFRLHSVNALVHVDHERVEVYATLLGNVGWECVVKQVHEHSLACPDIAVQIQALGHLFRGHHWGRGELPCKEAR